MSRGLLDPKVDFVFKNIFGSEKNPEILISFLNATLKPRDKIKAVKIKGNDIEKQFIEDKYSRLGVKATTNNNEIINIEMHFIEIPKLDEDSDERDMLVAWTEFLKNPESEKVRNLEMTIDEIRRAKDHLIRMSNDSEQRAIYDMREKVLKDKVSALNKAKEEGKDEKAIEIAKNALLMNLSIEQIQALTGLSKDAIVRLKQ